MVEGTRIRWDRVPWRQLVGGIFAFIGFVVTILVAAVGQPPIYLAASLVVISGLFQVAAAWVFRGHGKADPGLAQSSVRRLYRLAARAAKDCELAEDICDNGPPAPQVRDGMRTLSVELSWLQEGLVDAIEDWRTFHPVAVERVMKGSDEQSD